MAERAWRATPRRDPRIYSVMSYTVAQRERELAIRAAVGASRSSLLSMVLREGLLLSAAGIAAGAALAFAASGVLRSLLYNVSATDPLVFAGSAVGPPRSRWRLVPASRASRVEPVVALRRITDRSRRFYLWNAQ
jgi:ABC-type antimicrobial peptide transport system permease subunit